jgi:hypothetical protein
MKGDTSSQPRQPRRQLSEDFLRQLVDGSGRTGVKGDSADGREPKYWS